MKEDVNQRLKLIIEAYSLNQKKFAEAIGVPQTTISSFFVRGSKPSCEVLEQIINTFPQISAEWLLTGKGEMLRDNTELQVIAPNEIPLLPHYAQGGAMNDFVESVTKEDCERMISPIKEAQLAVPITGDSMYPEFPNGSIVLVKKIDESLFIEWGKAYVLDTCNGAVCKILTPSEKEDYIRCESVNEKYPPFEIKREGIYGIYRVLMCIIKK